MFRFFWLFQENHLEWNLNVWKTFHQSFVFFCLFETNEYFPLFAICFWNIHFRISWFVNSNLIWFRKSSNGDSKKKINLLLFCEINPFFFFKIVDHLCCHISSTSLYKRTKTYSLIYVCRKRKGPKEFGIVPQ